MAGLLTGCCLGSHGEELRASSTEDVAVHLKRAFKTCDSIPNGSVLTVSATTRRAVCLPEEFYRSKDLQVSGRGAMAGSVSNYAGFCQIGSDDQPRPCWGEGYEIGGWGEVEFSVKSSVNGVPDYRIRFVVVDEGPQLSISRSWPDGRSEEFTLSGDGSFSIVGFGRPLKGRFRTSVISAIQVKLADEALFGELRRWMGSTCLDEGTVNFAASYSSPSGRPSDPTRGPTYCGGSIPAVLDDLLEWLRTPIQEELPAYGGYFSERGERPGRFGPER
jgi:hypothetical protein